MNKTTKAKYELADKMLKGRIPVDEVVMMSGLSEEEVNKLNEKYIAERSEAAAFDNLDVRDFNMSEVIVDNYEDDFEEAFREYQQEQENNK